jgi:3-deoxy-manno-octulosonate cytidylyltransferase (CMP-KDO synthetase)
MEIAVVIPARFASTRLPGKPLLQETGKPLIVHVVEAAKRAKRVDRVIVATDDQRIRDVVHAHCGEAVMTRADHPSGTDRAAEAAAQHPQFGVIVNVQGDEPEIEPEAIDLVVDRLLAGPNVAMATLATPIRDIETFLSSACVKVVCSHEGKALYFSRAPIPFDRDKSAKANEPLGYLHLGIYAYRREFLLAYHTLPSSRLERLEKLEQLRALEAGHSIAVGIIENAPAGIDTPEDYAAFVRRWRNRNER